MLGGCVCVVCGEGHVLGVCGCGEGHVLGGCVGVGVGRGMCWEGVCVWCAGRGIVLPSRYYNYIHTCIIYTLPPLQELADHPDNHYGLNMVNQKITFPRDDNFSDDELAFLPYFTYCQANQVCN